MDGISLYFVLLTTFVTPIAILSNYTNIQSAAPSPRLSSNFNYKFKNKKHGQSPICIAEGLPKAMDGISASQRPDSSAASPLPACLPLRQGRAVSYSGDKLFLISFLVLETLQICAFVSLDLLLFYIFFESVLPILFIVIVIFGHGKDRFRSAFLFFLYTLAGSLPMLLSILVIYSYIGNTDFQLISLYDISLESQKFLWLGFFVAFAVKTPLYPFIIWLPKAHSDSPLAGSILLAATILKLATYGYLRVLINLLPDATNYFSPLVQTFAIISLI